MRPVVLKFGGTSVGTVARIKHVATLVQQVLAAGELPIVVVSAMAGETDRLLKLAQDISKSPDPREQDQLLATGEQVTIALLALALQGLGINSRSLTGFQVPIRTDSQFGGAVIKKVETQTLESLLDEGVVPVIAGFQGVTANFDLTTLGRGGSDLTAVAVAAALKLPCRIYTDVPGVFSGDPRICAGARVITEISYDEMLALADCGAKVLYSASVSYAMQHHVELSVCSTFEDGSQTSVVATEQLDSRPAVRGIASLANQCLILVKLNNQFDIAHGPNLPDLLARVSSCTGAVKVISDSEGTSAHLKLLIPDEKSGAAIKLLNSVANEYQISAIDTDRDIILVSLVGLTVHSDSAVQTQLAGVLASTGIRVKGKVDSEFAITLLVERKHSEYLQRSLHGAVLG